MRTFDTGATRDQNTDKFDYRGFISPRVLRRFACYMHKHRKQADGTMRASDNWKKGMPVPAYVESLIRHVVEFWQAYEEGHGQDAEESACAILFNVQGYLHETVNAHGDVYKPVEVYPRRCVELRPCTCRLDAGYKCQNLGSGCRLKARLEAEKNAA